jgi:serine protease AprX
MNAAVSKRVKLAALLSRRMLSLFLVVCLFGLNAAQAGLLITKSEGISLTGADGVHFVGTSGVSLTGADGILSYRVNGVSLTGADGVSLTGADGLISLTGADGTAFIGSNGISLTGADGISLTGADGISLTGADSMISLTGADGTTYEAASFQIINPQGISLTGADGTLIVGANGVQIADTNISLTGADGISLTGADGISLTGADTVTGFDSNGTPFAVPVTDGISLTGADGISLTGADQTQITNAQGIEFLNLGGLPNGAAPDLLGLQSVEPELALKLNELTDDSSVNAILVYHQYPTEANLNELRSVGILGGTRFRKLPFVIVTATRSQLIAVSQLQTIRSIYGVRTLSFNADPYFNETQIQRVAGDADLRTHNQGLPVSGRNVTVAVLDTGVNALHSDLAGRVVQNVKLIDLQSVPVLGFSYPIPVENLPTTDLISGHGTFVAGVVAASGAASGGQYAGVAPGAKILGLSAGDANLTHVLSGFDYLLEKGANYNVRVVNCSFSSNTVFDYHDPVNIATKMLTERGVSVVFSAGNSGAGNSTLNPYAAAPWVVSVGATDQRGRLASFSSRGKFGSAQFAPSLVAPGVNVVSVRSTLSQTGILGVATGVDLGRLSPLHLLSYTTASGTSFSAPQVAGAIALMLEANPNLQPAQIKDILRRTATPLPPYYQHEVGAGMLNTHAAVLEAAFANRRFGVWRATIERGQVKFITDVPRYFTGTVHPGSAAVTNVSFPADTVQSTIHLAWGGLLSPNDLGLKVVGNSVVRGESNNLNLLGLLGRREKVTLNAPPAATWQAVVSHSANLGTPQTFQGAVETTRLEFPHLNDIANLSPSQQSAVKESLRTFTLLPDGKNFRPFNTVTRFDLAAALVRGGRVPQFVAANPLYTDVRDATSRALVESVQKSPAGALIYDAPPGGAFRPHNTATRLVAAVALVKAAGFDALAQQNAFTPVPAADAASIPFAYRGYVTVALQQGLLAKEGANFSPNNILKRVELAEAMTRLNRIFNQ